MDHGKLTDHNGKKIDFRNVVLIMTTNAGASDAAKEAIGFGRGKREGEDEEAIKKLFTPEFRNRLDATSPSRRCRATPSTRWWRNSCWSWKPSWPTATSPSI